MGCVVIISKYTLYTDGMHNKSYRYINYHEIRTLIITTEFSDLNAIENNE